VPRHAGKAGVERRERERVAQRRRGPIEVDRTWARFDRRAEHRWHRTLTERGVEAQSETKTPGGGRPSGAGASDPRGPEEKSASSVRVFDDQGGGRSVIFARTQLRFVGSRDFRNGGAVTRGPLHGTLHRLPTVRRPDVGEEMPARRAPRAPSGLGADGRKAWTAVMSHAPLLLAALDVVAVERFCRLVDERAALAAELERGYVLEEPLVSPKGEVVGHRLVANPALGELRALDKALDALCDRLGLVPAARARLGLTFTTAEKQALEVDAVLDAKYRRQS